MGKMSGCGFPCGFVEIENNIYKKNMDRINNMSFSIWNQMEKGIKYMVIHIYIYNMDLKEKNMVSHVNLHGNICEKV